MGGRTAALLAVVGLFLGCDGRPGAGGAEEPPDSDGRVARGDDQAPQPGEGADGSAVPGSPPPLGPLETRPALERPKLPPAIPTRVAAIQYGSGSSWQVDQSCTTDPFPDLCAVLALMLSARMAGAILVVGPEYSQGQYAPERVPRIGENPGSSPAWASFHFTRRFSQRAATLQMFIVANIFTYEPRPESIDYYNSLIAFDPTGQVVGVHHKFNLWGGESSMLSKGTDVSVFSSPVGNVGMLICSDLTGDSWLREKLANNLKARVVAFSTHWMTSDVVEAQSNFAKTYKVYLVAANTTHPHGNGGGVYAPNGQPLVQYLVPSVPKMLFADLPPLP